MPCYHHILSFKMLLTTGLSMLGKLLHILEIIFPKTPSQASFILWYLQHEKKKKDDKLLVCSVCRLLCQPALLYVLSCLYLFQYLIHVDAISKSSTSVQISYLGVGMGLLLHFMDYSIFTRWASCQYVDPYSPNFKVEGNTQHWKLSEQLIHVAGLTCRSTIWSNISKELSFEFVCEFHKLRKASKNYVIRIKLSKKKKFW